jgi:hypothetical protein
MGSFGPRPLVLISRGLTALASSELRVTAPGVYVS